VCVLAFPKLRCNSSAYSSTCFYSICTLVDCSRHQIKIPLTYIFHLTTISISKLTFPKTGRPPEKRRKRRRRKTADLDSLASAEPPREKYDRRRERDTIVVEEPNPVRYRERERERNTIVVEEPTKERYRGDERDTIVVEEPIPYRSRERDRDRDRDSLIENGSARSKYNGRSARY